jgi:lysyl-tRNA synthetase class 2
MTKQVQTFTKSLEALRSFFKERQVTEVLTPPMVRNPGIEPHLHPFQVYSAHRKELLPYYLQTSPEFWMKWVLADSPELKDIYTLNYSFRDEPDSQWHRPQFLMLEWYRTGASLDDIILDCQGLYSKVSYALKTRIIEDHRVATVKEIMHETLNVNLDNLLTTEKIKTYILKEHPDLAGAEELNLWEDLFFLLFLNKVEPTFKNSSSLFLTHFPSQLAALSKLDDADPRYCLRFEWYVDGVEIANCFHELTNLDEQKQRARQDLAKKNELYSIEIEEPFVLYQALEKTLPTCSGIALGFERLIKVINKEYDFLY